MNKMKIAIQLYTLRQDLKKDFEATLEAVSELGFEGVEFASELGGKSPAELAALLKKLKLECAGIMPGADAILDGSVKELAAVLRPPALTVSLFGDFTMRYNEYTRKLKALGEAAAAIGQKFSYHNHAAELAAVDGVPVLDWMYRYTDPARVLAEIDIYWICYGGGDPVEYIRRYGKRMLQLHLKDMAKTERTYTELGNGRINLVDCIRAAKASDCRWLIYEQDECKRPPLESAKLSIDYLRNILTRV
ncbi:MAG: sugar phosphate isomerase/epimerase [Victivallales bacterium]|nr:sugar phosphate isomerase/epimerase [Victivallales bacterium]